MLSDRLVEGERDCIEQPGPKQKNKTKKIPKELQMSMQKETKGPISTSNSPYLEIPFYEKTKPKSHKLPNTA